MVMFEFVIMFLFLLSAQGAMLLPSLVEIFITAMQIGDLHRRLAQLSSQSSRKHPNNRHGAMKNVLSLKGS